MILGTSLRKSPIAHRFIYYTVVFSLFITIISTAIQLYRDYNAELKRIHSELEQIEDVHLPSLSAALWASNTQLLQTSIEGILQIRDIQYVEVRDEERLWAHAGDVKGRNNIQRVYAMDYLYRNRDIDIGKLMVNVSLDGVHQRLYDKVWEILVSNAVKIALVAIFIYILFYQLVARHLSAIAMFSENHDPVLNNALLTLDRSGKIKDELDAVVSSINDMHTRLGEQILIANQQRHYLSQTLNSIGDAVITTDNKGNVLSLNPVAEQLTGWTSEEAKAQSLKTIFPIVDASTRESIENPVEKVLTTGKTIYLNNHTTLISKSGKEYQIADSAAPIRSEDKILGMVLVFNDVTEQYKIRRELDDSISLLKKVTARVPGMVYQFELDADGNMSFPYMSDAVNQLYHLSVEEIKEDVNRIFSVTHPDDVQKLNDSIFESARNFSPWKLEYRICDKDGKVRWLYGDSVPEKVADGKILWHGFVTDITEKKEAEERLRRTQKMDALGKLTGGIAHDYNNMLGVVLGYSDLLINTVDAQSKEYKYIEQIRHAGERGAKLTKKLLAFSKGKSSDEEILNVNALIAEERHMLERTLTARITLNLKL
ncbi:MAG TPA: PAS domain S-box protein, partial [Gammaproteobacteria bacterium]|nr:PAS domain S-box protein [Gammaproteobacteria bacterium]